LLHCGEKLSKFPRKGLAFSSSGTFEVLRPDAAGVSPVVIGEAKRDFL
jgi:hypothetical protein